MRQEMPKCIKYTDFLLDKRIDEIEEILSKPYEGNRKPLIVEYENLRELRAKRDV